MASPETAPAHALIESDRVEGTAVHDREGRHTGTIKRLMIDKVSGQVAYVVVAFAFAGLSDDSYPIPWAKLRYDTGLGGYRTDVTEAELHGAPRFREGEGEQLGRDQEDELDAYFRIPPDIRAV
jgi:PRC-barrel domain protein